MEANKQGKINIAIGIVLFIIVFALVSCGARTVNRSKTETKETLQAETTKVDSSKTTTIANSNVKIVDSSSTDEFTVEAKDTTKPFTINSNIYRNVVLRHKKIKNNITTNKTENVAQTQQNNVKTQSKLNSSKSTKSNGKFVDKQQYDWTKTIIVISIILGLVFFLIYFFYIRKAKKAVEEVV